MIDPEKTPDFDHPRITYRSVILESRYHKWSEIKVMMRMVDELHKIGRVRSFMITRIWCNSKQSYQYTVTSLCSPDKFPLIGRILDSILQGHFGGHNGLWIEDKHGNSDFEIAAGWEGDGE